MKASLKLEKTGKFYAKLSKLEIPYPSKKQVKGLERLLEKAFEIGEGLDAIDGLLEVIIGILDSEGLYQLTGESLDYLLDYLDFLDETELVPSRELAFFGFSTFSLTRDYILDEPVLEIVYELPSLLRKAFEIGKGLERQEEVLEVLLAILDELAPLLPNSPHLIKPLYDYLDSLAVSKVVPRKKDAFKVFNGYIE